MTEFNLKNLFPRFECINNGELWTSDGITALFVGITIFAFLVFLLYSLVQMVKTMSRYRFYRNLVDSQTAEGLLTDRRDLLRKASEKEKKKKWPELWNEFDETLVEVDGQLKNTVDASHFFNTVTLAKGLVGNRFLAAGPGIITGLGVLGTFLGLQLGLGHLSLDGGTDQMTTEIQSLVASASIAFTTSVWGVFLSLIINLIEKFIENQARKSISFLQILIDELFPRFSESEILRDLRDDGRQSRETLQGLAERIGNRMQEAVNTVSQTLQAGLENSLKNVLAPAVNKLVTVTEELNQRQAKGSEDALRQLIEEFVDTVGHAGNSQRQALTAASDDMKRALSQFGNNMSKFFSALEDQQTSLRDDQDKRSKILEENFSAAINQQKQMIEYVQNSVGNQVDAAQSIIKQGEALGENVQHNSQMMDEVVNQMGQITNHLKSVSSHLENASGTLGNKIYAATEHVKQSTIIAKRLIEENRQVNNNVNNTMKLLDNVKSSILESTEILNKAAVTSANGYNELSQHYIKLQKEIEKQIPALETQLTKLMTDYGEMVNSQTIERLKTWDNETRNYTKAMNSAVESISSVVDEIEVKISHN
jgi:methyl-accepting chemotaxis protein